MKERRGLGGVGMRVDLQNEKAEVRSQKLQAKKKGRWLIGFSRILRNPVSEWYGCSGCSIAWLETKDGSQSCRIPREDRLPYGKKGRQVRDWFAQEKGECKLLPGHAAKIGSGQVGTDEGKQKLDFKQPTGVLDDELPLSAIPR